MNSSFRVEVLALVRHFLSTYIFSANACLIKDMPLTSLFSELLLFVATDTVAPKVNVEVNDALRPDSVASDV